MHSIDDLSQLKRLAIFAKVVEVGSFSKAAKALKMNRSGVSEQVAILEEYLGTRLLHRTTRRLSLTSDGEAVLPEANNIANSLQTIKDRLVEDAMAGVIRLTTTHDFAIQWLSPKLKTFQQEHQDIAFDLVLSDEKVDLVQEQIDLALRIGSPPTDSSLVARPFLRERLHIFASPDFLDTYGSEVDDMDALLRMPWIMLKQLMSSKGLPILSGKSNISFNLNPPRMNRVDSPVVMMEQVKMGLGLGMMFPSIVKREVERGELVQILPDWHSEELLFYILYSSRRQLPLRVKTFIEFLLS